MVIHSIERIALPQLAVSVALIVIWANNENASAIGLLARRPQGDWQLVKKERERERNILERRKGTEQVRQCLRGRFGNVRRGAIVPAFGGTRVQLTSHHETDRIPSLCS